MFKSQFGSFTIEVPGEWEKIQRQGIDSYIGRLAIDKNDTLEFDLGYYSNSLTEHEPDDFDGEYYTKKTKTSLHVINNYKASIVTPKKYGIGISGIYIDSLWEIRETKVKFNLFGTDLKKTNQKIFLRSIKTLKFSKP